MPKSKILDDKVVQLRCDVDGQVDASTVPPRPLTICSFWVAVNCSPFVNHRADGARGDRIDRGVALERVAGDVLGEVLMMRFFLRRANKPMS